MNSAVYFLIQSPGMLDFIWKPPNSTYLMAMALKYFVATVMCFEKYIEKEISKVIIFINGYKLTKTFFMLLPGL